MTTVNGQDVATGDIDDGRPEKMRVCPETGERYSLLLYCVTCGALLRDETDEEYWARVENMTPKCKDDLL